jgi:hypothetical protein
MGLDDGLRNENDDATGVVELKIQLMEGELRVVEGVLEGTGEPVGEGRMFLEEVGEQTVSADEGEVPMDVVSGFHDEKPAVLLRVVLSVGGQQTSAIQQEGPCVRVGNGLDLIPVVDAQHGGVLKKNAPIPGRTEALVGGGEVRAELGCHRGVSWILDTKKPTDRGGEVGVGGESFW